MEMRNAHHAMGPARLPASSTVSANGPWKAGSERVPGRAVGELEVADVGAQAHADARADRDEHDAVRGEDRHAEPADEVGRSVDAGEVLIDRVGGRQGVD